MKRVWTPVALAALLLATAWALAERWVRLQVDAAIRGAFVRERA